MTPPTTRRFRLSLRGLMAVVAVCALCLTPIAKSIHKNEQLRLGRLRAASDAKIARELGRLTRQQALRALADKHADGHARRARFHHRDENPLRSPIPDGRSNPGAGAPTPDAAGRGA